MRCLAKELAPRRIRVNTIHPGPIDNAFQLSVEEGLGREIDRDGTEFFNEIIPLRRHGSPDEIAVPYFTLHPTGAALQPAQC